MGMIAIRQRVCEAYEHGLEIRWVAIHTAVTSTNLLVHASLNLVSHNGHVINPVVVSAKLATGEVVVVAIVVTFLFTIVIDTKDGAYISVSTTVSHHHFVGIPELILHVWESIFVCT